jgi:hypothetical protein
MIRKQRDELLADHAGRAEDADLNRFHIAVHKTKKPTRLINRVGCLVPDSLRLSELEHTSSDTIGALGTEALSCAGSEGHEQRSIPSSGNAANDLRRVDAFFTAEPTSDYTLHHTPDGDLLIFPSAFATPHPENNVVDRRYFPARLRDGLKTVPYREVGRQRCGRRRPSGRPTSLKTVPYVKRGAYRETDAKAAVGDGLEAVPRHGRAAVLVLPHWDSVWGSSTSTGGC